MAITLQGKWKITVKEKESSYKQRYVVRAPDMPDKVVNATGPQTPALTVDSPQWTVSIEHQPTGSTTWLPSRERLTKPVQDGDDVKFDVKSDDSGGVVDFNDLVLTFSTPKTGAHVIYGKAYSYHGHCHGNPCFGPDYFVIETPEQLVKALGSDVLRSAITELYPDRVPEIVSYDPPIIKWPIPGPDPGPFRPMMIPTRASGDRRPLQTGTKKGLARTLGAAVTKGDDYDLKIAKFKDMHPFLRCYTDAAPGVVLRFFQYDRTDVEKQDGSFTGEGTRTPLGFAATDERGFYIFRFLWSEEESGTEYRIDTVAGEENPLFPDLIVQVLDPAGGPYPLYESPRYADVPKLGKVNVCFPFEEITPPVLGPVVQAIGRTSLLPGSGNTLDGDGRITTPSLPDAAWYGTLALYAYFGQARNVEYFTLKYRPGGSQTWVYVQEPYAYTKVTDLTGDLFHTQPVGPFFNGPGELAGKPAYLNIEDKLEWAAWNRCQKLNLTSYIYAPNTAPGTVEFLIEGYDANGNNLRVTDHVTFTLFIDNRGVAGNVASVCVPGATPTECGLYQINAMGAPLEIRFKVNQSGGFLRWYGFKAYRGAGSTVAIANDADAPGAPISASYDPASPSAPFFFGTVDVPGVDADGYVTAKVLPASGSWLPQGQAFCAFSFELYANARITDGINAWPAVRLGIQLIGLTYVP